MQIFILYKNIIVYNLSPEISKILKIEFQLGIKWRNISAYLRGKCRARNRRGKHQEGSKAPATCLAPPNA